MTTLGAYDLILLDEPTAGLAPNLVEELVPDLVAEPFEKVDEIGDTGTAVLMVEQNAEEAFRRCDRGYALVNGGNAYDGSGSDPLGGEEVRRRFLGFFGGGFWRVVRR